MVTAVLKSPAAVLLLAVFLTGGPWKAFFAALFFHELGHCIGARLVGIPLRRLAVGTGGLHLDFAMETASYKKELLVLLSGSGLGLLTLCFLRDPACRACTLCLNLANLLPLPGLDGGGILACLLQQRLDADRADRICRGVFTAAAVLLWTCGMWIVLRVGPNPMWMLCGMAALFQLSSK
ncbi:MAG: hypothetical protein E7631_07200 [Ruminococcaceae bacterium]|nr:hypothetical protein [Oscillospiraceae bacterium]